MRFASFKQEKIGIFFNSEDVSMATGVVLSVRAARVQLKARSRPRLTVSPQGFRSKHKRDSQLDSD